MLRTRIVVRSSIACAISTYLNIITSTDKDVKFKYQPLIRQSFCLGLADNSIDHSKPINANKYHDSSCDQTVCKSTKSMLSKAFISMNGKTNGNTSKATTSSSSPLPIDDANEVMPITDTTANAVECPLNKDELGSNTWNMLHTVAAYYPDNPTDEQKQFATSLIVSLAHLYPCSICAPDFQDSVSKHPPEVNSRTSLSLYVCRLHNEVNIKLGQTLFDCTIANLDERWRKSSDRQCNSDEDDIAP